MIYLRFTGFINVFRRRKIERFVWQTNKLESLSTNGRAEFAVGGIFWEPRDLSVNHNTSPLLLWRAVLFLLLMSCSVTAPELANIVICVSYLLTLVTQSLF